MIEHLLKTLQSYSMPNVFNPWLDTDPLDAPGIDAPKNRSNRLSSHFDVTPKFLLIGEAPGYQGCHFSGVPFTNEYLICAGWIPRIGEHGRFTTRKLPWREPSATIVWSTLHDLKIDTHTVLWNAFAFHPHRPGNLLSNRTPTKSELVHARPILELVVKHFSAHGTKIVAVGNVAYTLLSQLLTIKRLYKVRHPSMGGATEFRAGMKTLVQST